MPAILEKPDGPVRTMEEFSLFVGLSRPTVSRFFNDPSALKDSTRRRIETALEASGFRPNLLAANLVRGRSSIIGVVIPDSGDPFYTALTRRVQVIAEDAGFHVFVLSSNGDAEREARAVGTLASLNVAGAIVAPLGIAGQAALERLQTDVPLVYVDAPPRQPAAFVGTDNRSSFRAIVDYLCETGTAPRFLGMPNVNGNAMDRVDSYRAAMRARGLEPRVEPLPNSTEWDFERFGFDAMQSMILTGNVAGSTVLCANDRLAFGAIAAAWQAGLRVGTGENCDLRIAGHDDHPLSRFACPPLTTVAQDYDEIARQAMTLLQRSIAGHDLEGQDVVLLGTRIIRRQSA